jgi:hypothetical protein
MWFGIYKAQERDEWIATLSWTRRQLVTSGKCAKALQKSEM